MIKTARLPSLDGWRAVSIILVLGTHSQVVTNFPKAWNPLFDWLFDGNLGVRFFFVISGFLITHLLLQEQRQNGSISLRKFYIRRALRILPVYFVFLFVVALLQQCTAWRQSPGVWLANLTFTTNFINAPWATGHLWSLAVEEQFYLLWPLLLVLLGRRNDKRRIFYVVGIPLVIAPVWRVLSYAVTHGINTAALNFGPLRELSSSIQTHPTLLPVFQDSSFLNYFDSLAVGCIAAMVLGQPEGRILAGLKRFKWGSILGGGVLVLTPYILRRLGLVSWFTLPCGITLQAIGFALLLLQSVLVPQLFKPLNWPPVRQLGVLSYSIYIWQQLFCADPHSFGFSPHWFMAFPGWLVAAGLLATFSYYGLEKPLLGLRANFRKTGQP